MSRPDTVLKDKVYGYLFKVVLSLITLFCLYNVVSILFLSPYSGKKLRLRISSTVNAIEYNIKRAGLENTEKAINNSILIESSSVFLLKLQIVYLTKSLCKVDAHEHPQGMDDHQIC